MSDDEPVETAFDVKTRGDAAVFARRTLKNLEHIERSKLAGSDVHPVTQLTNSLLGLVIFPWEKDLVSPIEGLTLKELSDEGWPEWKIERDLSKAPKKHKTHCLSTLGDLVYHIRNAVAHRRIRFLSDSAVLSMETLNLEDGKWKEAGNEKSVELYWWGEINATLLREFVQKLAAKIDDLS